MYFTSLIVAAFAARATVAQSTTSLVLSGTQTATDDVVSGADYPTGSLATYQSYTATLSLSSSSIAIISGQPSSTLDTQNVTITTNGTVLTTVEPTQTVLTRSTSNNTAVGSSTSSSARPTNTQPCNGYPELCQRKYSNITNVAAHNSPFSIQGNVASNQALDVTTQLNDGIRGLQFQVHKPNASSPLLLCHSSCELLSAGTLVDYLRTVTNWLEQNPYEVLTIVMGNSDYVEPGNFTDPVVNSGLSRYLYTPPTVPMTLDQWPTLGEMIITQSRVVIMLDYDANQTAIPWLLDEFANMWETPFSPVDRAFPCNQDRPPGMTPEEANDRLYLANHNLNVDIQVAGLSLLIPATTLLNETNAITGFGSVGLTNENCTATWNRSPNFLLVDYYNIGSFNGSVFQVAADANGVTYNRDNCCGSVQRQNAAHALQISSLTMAAAVGVLGWLFW